jgi:hypothetical protein
MESASVLQQFRNRLCTLSCPELITNTIFVGSTVNSQQSSTLASSLSFSLIARSQELRMTAYFSTSVFVCHTSEVPSPISHPSCEVDKYLALVL